MLNEVKSEAMINYLQCMLDDFMAEEKRYGFSDRIVQKKMNAMLACAEMVENMIGVPVNMQMDGKVTLGF